MLVVTGGYGTATFIEKSTQVFNILKFIFKIEVGYL